MRRHTVSLVHFDRSVALRAMLFFLFTIAAARSVAAEVAGRAGIIAGASNHSVAIEGDYAVVGAPWLHGFKGGAFVLARDGNVWRVAQKLTPDDVGTYDHFGASVSIVGGEIRVSAPWQNLLRGAVYVFERSGDRWVLREELPGAARAQGHPSEPAGASAASAAAMSDDALAAIDVVRTTSGPPPIIRGVGGAAVEWVSATDASFEDRVEIKWAPLDRDAILYKILRDGVLIGIASSDDSLYNDDTGARGVSYDYCVAVMDMAGGEAPPTCDAGGRVIRAPERLFASDGQFIDGVHLTWEDRSSVEAGFYVRRAGVPIATLERNQRSYLDTTAVPLAVSQYEVVAFDSDGNRSGVATDAGYRGVVLPPVDVSASDGEYADSVRVRWVSQGVNVGFIITRRDLVATQPVVLDTTAAGVQEFFDTTAQAGARYQYCVAALDAQGRLSVPTCDEGGVDLGAPLSVAASDSTFDDRIQVKWEDHSELADGYYVRRDGVPIDTVASSKRIFNDYDASPNATHTYCVVAFNDHGGVSGAGCDSGFRMIVLAPTGVKASDGDFEDRTRITWESSSTTLAVFKILRDGVTIKTVGAGARSYTDDGGTAGKEYVYGVQAVTGRLESSTVSTDPGRRELRKPINVAATNDDFEDRVEVSWRDVSAVETGFVIYRRAEGAAAADSIGETSTGTTSLADRTGEPGVTYHYSVAAFDTKGEVRGESDPSAEDDGVRTLFRPTAVDATDGTYEDRVEITWKDHSNVEDGYRVYRDGVPIAATRDNATSYIDSHPRFGLASEYSVRAFDPYGTSQADSDSGSTTLLAPGSFNASDTYEDEIVLRWVDVSEVEDGYVVQVDSAGVRLGAYTMAAGATSFHDRLAVPGVTYEYRLRAFAAAAVSAEVHDQGVRPVAAHAIPTTALDGTLARTKKLTGRTVSDFDGGANDFFGWSLAVGGDHLIVGAPGDNPRGGNSGSAFVFQRGPGLTWTQEDNIWAGQDGAGGDRFGEAVAIDGNRAIVGMPRRQQQYGSFGNYSGLALMFNRHADGTWTEGDVLSPLGETVNGDPQNPSDLNDRFGQAVAISGDMWAVGAPGDNLGLNSNVNVDFGAIYFYQANRGSPTKFFASDAADRDSMGISVAILGDWAVAGAPGRDDRGNQSGAAYVFKRFIQPFGRYDWSQNTKLTASDGTAGAAFGRSVLRTGDRIIVGAPRDVGIASGPGAVYVFALDPEDGTWKEEATLHGSGIGTDRFGTSLAMWEDWLLVGAPGEEATYVFRHDARNGWSVPSRFVASGGQPGDRFGEAVGIGNEWGFAGARADDIESGASTLADAGSVFDLLLLGTVTDVVASDGTVDDRVHITWTDHSASEDGHIIYRDGVEYVRLGPNENFYDDVNAEPGRAFEYAVAAISSNAALPSERASDFGWRPPNGTISGRITNRLGNGVPGVSVCLEPSPTRALLFDGVGGHVVIPDDGTFNFTASQDFTIEAWFRYAGSDRAPRIISKLATEGRGERPVDLGLQRSGRLFFTMSDGANVARVLSARSGLANDTWHHVACVHDGGRRTLALYIDGVREDSVSTLGLGDVTNRSDVLLGGLGPATWYGGQLDELRIWNVPRSAAQVVASKGAPLTGSEPGLLGYWTMDEVSGRTITDFAGVAQYGTFVGGVYRTDQVAPIDFCTATDADGAFIIRETRYEQNGTNYKLRPSLESRQFSPAVMPITLNRDNPVENQLVFSDVSSHSVSGAVQFAGTNCFEPDVEIWVDNSQAATSDRNGKFALTLTEGLHTIRVQHRDYTYRVAFLRDTLGADSVSIDVRADVRDLAFLNRTTYPVSGKVGGGCDRYIGQVKLRYRSENNCIDTTFVGNPEYTIHLPPMRYFASATIDRETIPASLNRPDVITFFENLGERPVNLVAATDSTVIDDQLDFIYRAPLRVTVSGFEPYVSSICPQLQLEDGTMLPAGLPVIPQGTFVNLAIHVAESYGDSLCPLDTGRVVILDEIFDQENHPDTLTVSDGVAQYRTFASTPSLIRGRTEGTTDRSFQKSFIVRTIVEGRTAVTATQWALVTGHVAPEGAEFVTVPSTEFPLYILRDPPGDGSSAYIEEGTTGCARLEWTNWSTSDALGFGLNLKFGATSKIWVGVGGGTIDEIDAHTENENKLLVGTKISSQKTYDMCVQTTRRLSTASADGYIGADADLFVGAGIAFLFSEVGVISTEGCEVRQSSAIGFEPDSIYTTYAFTQGYIKGVLIPRLNGKVAYFEAQGDADSADVFRTIRDQWQFQIDFNRRDKMARADSIVIPGPLGDLLPPLVVPRPKENRSFSAGTQYEFARQQSRQRQAELKVEGTVKFDTQILTNFGIHKKLDFKVGFFFETENEFLIPALSSHTDTTATWKTGYVLTDGDSGDDFTVDLVESAKTGYFFDVLGGRSSCPYEAWPKLDSGKASMAPRDKPQLLIDPHDRFGVAPDKPALFKLAIANLSNEPRDYTVRLLSNSNPGGAIVRLNGTPISDRPAFSIDGTGSGNANVHEATLSVERGPSRFNYRDLRLVVEPACGDAAVAETLSFSVSYEGCSDIALSGPDVVPGWTYNRADSVAGKALDLVLSGYELIVDPAAPNVVQAVGIQYRSMGDGRTGPGPWTDIRESVPGIVADASVDGSRDTILVWRPDSLANGAYEPLADGVYELRAYTVCSAGGRGYSNASTGTIDRHAPVVFGTPAPSDGELSLGEDIGVTFNEPLDCDALRNATVVLRYVDGPQAGQAIPVTTTCDGRTILIVPKVDPATLDGRRLEAAVSGVADRVGNVMTSAVTWRFDYRKSLFTWGENRIVREVALVTPGKVSARLVNGTNQPLDYEVTTVPGFLTVPPAQARGRLAPGGERTIEFDVDPSITGGIHQGQVSVRATDASSAVTIAVLDVVLDVSCAAPQWTIDPSRFEHSMSLVSRVGIVGGTLTRANDLVAAFVGDQLRGLARPKGVAGDTLVFLTVFSNRTSGETVRFEVWDDDRCKRYGSTAERAPFSADAVLGTTITPFILTAQDAPPASVASFPLHAGWNWFSTYVASSDMTPGSVLASLAPAAGDIIKSKTQFAVFDPDTSIGWVGSLANLNNTSGYMVRLTEAGTVLHEGTFADPGATAVPIANGWNWIGYLPTTAMSVGTALGDLVTRGFLNGDEIVKSQGSFSEWNSGWFGSLETMGPGQGYRLSLDHLAQPSSFNYPGGAPGLVAELESPARAETPAANAAGWPFDPGGFEYNMTLIAQVEGDGLNWDSEDNHIGAFVGDECRGVVPLMLVRRLGKYLVFATVHSNRMDGETVRFRAFHAASKTTHDLTETVVFQADAPLGTIREPIPLSAGPVRGALPTAFRLAPARPSPFQHTTTIRFELPQPRHVVLKIYDVAGLEVCTVAEGDYPAGVYDVPWDARTGRGDRAPNGVYFIRITAGPFVDVKRVVLVR